jgi:hypothetical protein
MGGSDEPSNLVDLTPREHYLAHWLLFKIHRNGKTAAALALMTETRGRRRGRDYQEAIARRSDMLSEHWKERWKTEEHRAKMGAVYTPEHRAKVAENTRRKQFDPEYKRKQLEGAKRAADKTRKQNEIKNTRLWRAALPKARRLLKKATKDGYGIRCLGSHEKNSKYVIHTPIGDFDCMAKVKHCFPDLKPHVLGHWVETAMPGWGRTLKTLLISD